MQWFLFPQLETKKVGGADIANPLQSIDYRYNIRGWMTKINDPSNLNGKLFGYEIKYNNPQYNTASPGKFNGNIAEIDWKNSSEDILKRYNYEYDALNRLKNGFYSEPNATNPSNGNFDEYLTYDLNGNINTLKRKAVPVSGGTSTLVDNLEYKYTGNRLNQIIESAMNDTGYEGGNNMIDYDLNGNMINMKDKGISTIVYNYLNLPKTFAISHPDPIIVGQKFNSNIGYLYRADGTKLRKIYSTRPARGLTSTTMTDYLDGFQYSYREGGGICITCRTEFAFEQQAYGNLGTTFPDLGETPSWKLDFVNTSEGFYSFTENRYIYQYKDHLGNTRVSFAKDSAGGLEVTDTNNYYPFGLNHISGMFGSSNFGGYYSYKFQEQELQETGFYAFKWRNYMPDVGRFFNIDPLSEKYAYQSHYNFSENRVVNARELEGLEAVPTNGNECDIQWKVKINNNLGSDYSKTLLSDTSKILSQNGVTINVVEDANATFTVNLENPKVDLKNMQLINGESTMDGDTYGGAVTSKDSPRTLAHELGHKAGQDHIFDDTSKVPNTTENKDNLMNSGGNTNESLQSTTGTKLQEVQSNDMKSHINTVYQNTQKIMNNEKNNNKAN